MPVMFSERSLSLIPLYKVTKCTNRSCWNHVRCRWWYGTVSPLNRRRQCRSLCCWNNSSLNVVGFPWVLRWNVTPPYCDVLPVGIHNKPNYNFIFFSDTKCLSFVRVLTTNLKLSNVSWSCLFAIHILRQEGGWGIHGANIS